MTSLCPVLRSCNGTVSLCHMSFLGPRAGQSLQPSGAAWTPDARSPYSGERVPRACLQLGPLVLSPAPSRLQVLSAGGASRRAGCSPSSRCVLNGSDFIRAGFLPRVPESSKPLTMGKCFPSCGPCCVLLFPTRHSSPLPFCGSDGHQEERPGGSLWRQNSLDLP